jgi:hypothetical protein
MLKLVRLQQCPISVDCEEWYIFNSVVEREPFRPGILG